MKIAILDGNNICYKIWSAMNEGKSGLLKTSEGIPTSVIYGLLKTINSLTEKTRIDRFVVCWDVGGGSKYRKSIYPLYKGNRSYKDMGDYFKELDSVRDYLDVFGIRQGIAKGIECDDLIGYLSAIYSDMGNSVIIVSDDKDFYQLVKKTGNGGMATGKIKIFRPIKNEFINYEEVKEMFGGMLPRHLPRIKALTGEDSDFIPGVADIDEKNRKLIKKGLGEKTAMKILYGKKNLREAIDLCNLNRWKELLKKKRKQIKLSYKLAKIRIWKDDYQDWEKKVLDVSLEKIIYSEKVGVNIRKINRLVNALEIKSFNVIGLLRKIGVNLDDS